MFEQEIGEIPFDIKLTEDIEEFSLNIQILNEDLQKIKKDFDSFTY